MSSAVAETASVSLDLVEPLEARVGYGQLGRNWSLGYENKRVTIQSSFYSRALSTHPPARLVFELGKRFATFRCKVTINEDVPAGKSHAQFSVLADGRHVSVTPLVTAGQAPREIVADDGRPDD
jgi:hypothetical protein